MRQKLEKIQLVLFCALAASFPFDLGEFKLNSYLIVLSIITTFSLSFFPSPKKNEREKWTALLFFSFYFIHVAGLLLSDNREGALFELQKKASLLLFPVLFLFSPSLDGSKVRIILLSFVFSTLAVAVYSLVFASVHYISTGDTINFFYHALSNQVNMHATYLAMYFCFSIIILLVHIKRPSSRAVNIFYYLSVLLLAVCIALLGSRTQMLILVLIAVIFFIVLLRDRIGVYRSILVAMLAGVSVLGVLLLIPANRERFKEAINYKNQYGQDRRWSEEQVRYLIWSSALDLIDQNALTGVGTGDVQDELHQHYLKKEYISLTYLENTRYNAHNQFLETAVGFGMPGVLLLLSCFLAAGIWAFKKKNFLYLIFLLMFFISCQTESMLERQWGIVFYSFFNALLFFYKPDQEHERVAAP